MEPFAGSAGYSLRYPHLRVRLNDADPTIAALWQYLIGVSEAEIRALPEYVAHVSEVPGPPEARSLVGFWLNKGMTAPCNVPSKWVREAAGTGENYWGAGVRERVATQVQYIRHWTVTCGSYADVPDALATWYVDPPYAVSGKRYKYHSVDFEHLAAWCLARSGQVIVCEQAGADWLPFVPFRDLKALEGKHGAKVSHEVIYYRA